MSKMSNIHYQTSEKSLGLSDPPCFMLDIPCYKQQVRIELIPCGTNSFFIKDQKNLENCYDCLKIWPKKGPMNSKTYENWMKENSDFQGLESVSDHISW